MFSEKAEALRRRLVKPWNFRLYLLGKLPLALAAGLRLVRLDEQECRIALPGGWRTQNPFGSTYFAAQAMAAEMSTGAPAIILAMGAPRSVALILVEIRAEFQKRIVGRSTYSFVDLAGMKQAVDRACGQDDAVTFTARSTAYGPDGTACSAFEVTWSFKRRAAKG
jgi:hypothetical protein